MAFLQRFKRRDLEPLTILALDRGTAVDTRSERKEHRRLFGLIKGDRDLRESATVFAMTRFEDAVAAGEVEVDESESGTGRLQKFFEWVLAHKDEIIAFIKMIVGMVGGAPVLGMGALTQPQSAIFGVDASAVARKILEIVEIAERHGVAARKAVEAYIASAWPEGEPAPPAELQRALVA